MNIRYLGAMFVLGVAGLNAPAFACIAFRGLEITDVEYADLIVVGRIVDYRIILDQEVREKRRKQLEKSTSMSPAMRKLLSEQRGFVTDYAKFKVKVDEVLRGKAARTITVTWDNSTFVEPETMPEGPFLIALRESRSVAPPIRGGSASVVPNKAPSFWTVVQSPCSKAFIFDAQSTEAVNIRTLLGARSMSMKSPPWAKSCATSCEPVSD